MKTLKELKELSVIAAGVTASTTMSIDAAYKAMRAEGIDVIGFGAGEPDFDTPEHIKGAGIRAICENKTRYTPAAGIPELRKAVCTRLQEDCGLHYTPEQIVVSSGAKHNLYATLRVLINPGDEVILPAPYWVSYYELIKMVGAVPVVIQTSVEDDFKMNQQQLKNAITPKTKALILNNPSNPSGMLYDEAALRMIAALCVENNLYVVADEIYYGLIYDAKPFCSLLSLGEEIKQRSILINGVSKSYAMTGWRIGYAAAPEHIAKLMANYLSHATSAPSSISQWAAVEALSGEQLGVEAMRKEFEQRRDYICQRINAIPSVSCLKPEGAFYVMMNIEKLVGKTIAGVNMTDSDAFAQVFLQKGLVAVVPCTGFGAPHHVRWSYATSMENIKKGMDRLEHFLTR